MKTKLIQVPHNLGTMEYSEKGLQKDLQDLSFLKDAFLVLLNPEVAKKSDLPFDREQVIKYAKEMYIDSSYSQDFINEVFNIET